MQYCHREYLWPYPMGDFQRQCRVHIRVILIKAKGLVYLYPHTCQSQGCLLRSKFQDTSALCAWHKVGSCSLRHMLAAGNEGSLKLICIKMAKRFQQILSSACHSPCFPKHTYMYIGTYIHITGWFGLPSSVLL